MRNNPKLEPLNTSDNSGIIVDEQDAAAVIIAPGPALAGQQRGRGRMMHARAFLEGPNGETPPVRFAHSASGNDRLLAISSADWRAVIEPRVAQELALHLRKFAARHDGAMPWLIKPEDLGPAAAPTLGQARGWLAVHAPAGESGKPFATVLKPSWALEAAAVSVQGDPKLIGADCLRRMPCTLAGGTRLALSGPGECLWWKPAAGKPVARELARCVLEITETRGAWQFDYIVDMSLEDDDGDLEIAGPTADQFRTRSIATTSMSRITADRGLWVRIAIQARGPEGQAVARIESTSDTSGNARLAGLRYALDADGGELPAWLVNNAWQREFLIVHAPCAADRGRCPALRLASPAGVRTARALLVAAGPPLIAHPGRASLDLAAWFESPNLEAVRGSGLPFSNATASATRNDRVYIVQSAP